MRIRMKAKYYHGHGIAGAKAKAKDCKLLRDDPVLQNCKHEGERQALKEQYDAGEITRAQYDEARTKIFQQDKKYGQPPILIDMHLKHGDLVVMHGAELQKYYEVWLPSLGVFHAMQDSELKEDLTESSMQWLRTA